MKVSAVIPAKKTSIRLPNKNMARFYDTTLLGYKIRALRRCKEVDEIIVGSDCERILIHAKEEGAIPVKRPDEFCDESICSANDMIGDLCGRIKTDLVVWTHCTNPNISSKTYGHAVEVFLNNRNYDSLVSVDLVQEHLWQDGKPLNYNPWAKEHTLAKDLPHLYKQNGAFFIQSHEQMLENSYFFGKKPYLFVTPSRESTDVNTPDDLRVARLLN